IQREKIPGLADRAYNIQPVALSVGILANRPHIMMCLIERGSDEIVHAGIHDDERFGLAALEIKRTRDQDACVADDEATGLEYEHAIEIARGALYERGISAWVRRGLITFAIRNSEPAPQVNVADCVPIGAQRAHKVSEHGESLFEGGEIGDLATDVHVNTDHFQARKLRREG